MLAATSGQFSFYTGLSLYTGQPRPIKGDAGLVELQDVIMAIGAVLGTSGFLGTLRLLYLARPDREKTEAERDKLLADVRATTIAQWHELADARQEEILGLRRRLTIVEECLEDTRAQLRIAEGKVLVLEAERETLLRRIDELEGRR